MLGVRKATADDAAGIVAVWECMAGERIHSAIVEPWSLKEQAAYLRNLTPREAFHVAVEPGGRIVGFQSLDQWSRLLQSLSHVGQLGTFLLPEW